VVAHVRLVADARLVEARFVSPINNDAAMVLRITAYPKSSAGSGHIDKTTLRDNLYVPQGYEDRESQFDQIRTTMLQVLRGEHPIPMTMVGPVHVEEPIPAAEELPIRNQPVLPPPPGPAQN
jgi:hypothetical protein